VIALFAELYGLNQNTELCWVPWMWEIFMETTEQSYIDAHWALEYAFSFR